jgi:hypothetical protein
MASPITIDINGNVKVDGAQVNRAAQQVAQGMNRVQEGFAEGGGHLISNIFGGMSLFSAAESFIGRFKEMILGSFERGRNIMDISEQANISTTALQKYEYAAKMTGATTADVANAFKHLSMTMGAALKGDSDAIHTLDRLGVSMEEIRGLSKDTSVETVFRRIALNARDALSDPIVASDLFKAWGRGAESLFPGLKKNFLAIANRAIEEGQVLPPNITKSLQETGEKQIGFWGRMGTGAATIGANSGKVLESIGWFIGEAWNRYLPRFMHGKYYGIKTPQQKQSEEAVEEDKAKLAQEMQQSNKRIYGIEDITGISEDELERMKNKQAALYAMHRELDGEEKKTYDEKRKVLDMEKERARLEQMSHTDAMEYLRERRENIEHQAYIEREAGNKMAALNLDVEAEKYNGMEHALAIKFNKHEPYALDQFARAGQFLLAGTANLNRDMSGEISRQQLDNLKVIRRVLENGKNTIYLPGD